MENGADELLVISQMGDTDIKITKEHYYKNRKTERYKADIINRISEL